MSVLTKVVIPPAPGSAPRMSYNPHPLVRPGGPMKLQEVEYGGPASGRDVRMTLDRETLDLLTGIAQSSIVGQVQMNLVGLRIAVWQGTDGHVFETWALTCANPPEPAASQIEVGLPDDLKASLKARQVR